MGFKDGEVEGPDGLYQHHASASIRSKVGHRPRVQLVMVEQVGDTLDPTAFMYVHAPYLADKEITGNIEKKHHR